MAAVDRPDDACAGPRRHRNGAQATPDLKAASSESAAGRGPVSPISAERLIPCGRLTIPAARSWAGNKNDPIPVRDVRNPKMTTNHHIVNETTGPAVKRYGRLPKAIGKLALSLSVLSLAIALGTGCSSTGGVKAHLLIPAAPSGSQGMNPLGDHWYHPPESPGVAEFGDA